jgi:hypothetical protein
VRQFARATRNRDGEWVGGAKLAGGPGPAQYAVALAVTGARTVPRADRRPPSSATERVGPPSYQVASDLVRPSYNVRYDPGLKMRAA